MNLHEEQKIVQKAMNAALSGLQEDPWLVQRVLAAEKGERTVKRRISFALVLSITAILVMMGTAYALFSSQVAEFFGQHWNQELGARLQEGKIARIGESVTVGDVVITLDEIVYRDRGLYGVGTVRPIHQEDVLVPMDAVETLIMSHEEYLLPNEDPSSPALDAALAFVSKARSTGGKMLTVESMPMKIGVDEGTMLMPGTIGFYDIANEDGSVTYSFEASDGFAVNEGTTYQIRMESTVMQLDEEGNRLEDTLQRHSWIVSCEPVFMNDTRKPSSDHASNVTVLTERGFELITPAEYQASGTMPVYQAIETDFTRDIQPEWFNGTGIAAGAGADFIQFNDHAILSAAPEALFYDEYADSQYSEGYSGAIVRIIWVKDWPDHRGEFDLEKTELTGITLEDAKQQAETIIARLGIDCNQYVCQYALDMSLERIQAMGAIYEKAIVDGELLTDDDWVPYDYSAIPASEEGFYLEYRPAQIDSIDAGGRYGLQFFVNSRGIVFAHLRNQFNRGERIGTPEKLITHEEAISRFHEEINRSRYGSDEQTIYIRRAVLTYEPVRASGNGNGMVFVPTWAIMYQDQKASLQEFEQYALFNAIDGTLIDASFR